MGNDMHESFTVLFVGGSGTTRAPIAQLLLRHAAGLKWGAAAAQWVVQSAGLDYPSGAELAPFARRALEGRGVVIPDFEPKAVTVDLLADADLILTMERTHRSRVVTQLPAVLSRAFTFRQFVTLAGHLPTLASKGPAEQGHQLVDETLAHRGEGILPHGQLDIADPTGRSFRRVRASTRELSAGVDIILRACEG